MIDEKQIGWLKEFLFSVCVEEVDRNEVDEILDTFRKLWVIAHASIQNPYPRSPRLTEALGAIKAPPRAKPNLNPGETR